MKSASTTLISFLNAVIGSPDIAMPMADAFLFTLRNGTVLAYTNSDVTFAYSGNTYLGNNVLISGLKYKAAIGLEVDSQKVTVSARSSDTIAGGAPILQALRSGAFDGAEVVRQRVFWSDAVGGTLVGGVILFKGRFGKIDSLGRTTAEFTVNSDLVLLDIDMPRNIYQPTCLHTTYDAGCTLLASSFTTSGAVGAGSTAALLNWSGSSLNHQQGVLTFSSGLNAGVSITVGSVIAGVSMTPVVPLQSVPAAGDAFSVTFGDDHTPGTCHTRFNNLANFRGFPYVPPPQMAV